MILLLLRITADLAIMFGWTDRGPLNLLVWMSLNHESYATIPRVIAARKGLCVQAHATLMGEWRSRRHVHEYASESHHFNHARSPAPSCAHTSAGSTSLNRCSVLMGSFVHSRTCVCHFGVYRNYNATTAEGCDVGNSNPFYHWGALSGYIAMREAMTDQNFTVH